MNTDIPDLIAGAIGVSRGTAYDLMREALAEQPAQQEPKPKFVRNVDGVPCITLVEHEHLMRSRSKPAQQEPVAWRTKNAAPPGGYVLFQQYPKAVADLGGKIEPLYTSPPASKPWVWLTDEEIHKMTVLMGINPEWKAEMEIVRSVVRNLEAKLREKNA